jgi:ketosteroid isomerase-like protein
MTPDEMDELFARHCAAEFANDTAGILDSLTDDVEHDVVGDPAGVLYDRGLIAKRYHEVFTALADESLTRLRRYYGDGYFVDDSMCDATVRGQFLGMPGNNRRISFRLLHVCDVKDGRISRENVWMDVGAVMGQLGTPA